MFVKNNRVTPLQLHWVNFHTSWKPKPNQDDNPILHTLTMFISCYASNYCCTFPLLFTPVLHSKGIWHTTLVTITLMLDDRVKAIVFFPGTLKSYIGMEVALRKRWHIYWKINEKKNQQSSRISGRRILRSADLNSRAKQTKKKTVYRGTRWRHLTTTLFVISHNINHSTSTSALISVVATSIHKKV